jgi:hypothetical protein
MTDWARQMLLLVRRWWPEREIVAVADSGYACIRLLAACRRFLPKPLTFVTRLRLDGLIPDERTIFAYATAASSSIACSYSVGLR